MTSMDHLRYMNDEIKHIYHASLDSSTKVLLVLDISAGATHNEVQLASFNLFSDVRRDKTHLVKA